MGSNARGRSGARWKFPAAAGAAVLLLCCAGEEGPIRPPDPGPVEFILVDVNPFSPTRGDSVSLSAFRGEPVVLYAGSAG